MLGRVNHIAIAVPDLAAATTSYRDRLGAKVSQAQALPDAVGAGGRGCLHRLHGLGHS